MTNCDIVADGPSQSKPGMPPANIREKTVELLNVKYGYLLADILNRIVNGAATGCIHSR